MPVLNLVISGAILSVTGLVFSFSARAGKATTPPSSVRATAHDTVLQPVSRNAFKSPPAGYGPFIRWWWPGGDVEDDELAREVKLMSSAGFAGAEIQSFAVGLPRDASDRVFTYGSKEWFDHLGTVLEQANRLGFTIDLTLGSAWPPGGAHIDDTHGLKQLIYTSELVQGPRSYENSPPGVSKPLRYQLASAIMQIPDTFRADEMTLLRVTAVQVDDNQGPILHQPAPPAGVQPLPQTIYLKQDTAIDLTAALDTKGVLHWDIPSGRWAVFSFFQGPTRSQPFYAAENGGNVLDHLDRDAAEIHLQTIGGAARQRFGQYFGNTLRALFVDSFELRTELFWNESFLKEFETRRGYSLVPFLPILFRPFYCDTYLRKLFPGAAPYFEYRDAGPRVREDYDQTVSELMMENFIAPVVEWGQANNIMTRMQTHGGPFDILAAYRRVDIPETEGLYAGGRLGFLKAAASAGHQAGSGRISSEVLAFPKGDYATNPIRVLAECNRQLAAGVNQLIMHGFPYVYEKKFLAPGWMPFSSPYLPGIASIGTFGEHLNDRNPPLWQSMPPLNLYLSRAQYVLSAGESQADVALYADGFNFPDTSDPDPQINQTLEASGYAFDYLDDEGLSQAKFSGGVLTAGHASYRALVVFGVQKISETTAGRLVELARAGLPILFIGDVPSRALGYLNYKQRDSYVQAQMESIFKASLSSVKDSGFFRNGSAVYHNDVTAVPTVLHEDFEISPSVVLGDAKDSLKFSHRRAGTADFYFVNNLRDNKVKADLQFRDDGRIPEIWNLWTGDVDVAPMYSKSGGMIKVHLEFEPGSAALIGFSDATPKPVVFGSNFTTIVRGEGGQFVARTRNPGTYTVVYDNGSQQIIRIGDSTRKVDPLEVTSWRLTAIGKDISGNDTTVYFPQFALADWRNVSPLSGFAGTGTYVSDFYLDSLYLQPGLALTLDLGDVHDTAEVSINGMKVASLIAPPFEADISGYVRAGINEIQIQVSTALRNRYVGFGLAGADYFKQFVSGSPALIPTGLIGPVRIVPEYQVQLDSATAVRQTIPVPLGLNIVPAFIPPPSGQSVDFLGAMQRARELTSSVSFSFFWRDPLTGTVTTADDVAPLVVSAKQLGLEVIVQLLPFFVGEPAVPYDFGPTTFANLNLQRAFLDQAVKLAKLQPDYLILGTELNFGRDLDPREYAAYIPIYKQAYDLIKEISPNTLVGTNYQYDYLKKGGAANNNVPDWSAVKDIGDKQDFVGLNTYFGGTIVDYNLYPTPADVPKDYYDEIRKTLGPDRRVLITEFAWTSFFGNGKQNQADFINRVPELLQNVRPGLVIWPLQHDIQYYTGFLEGLNYAGLLERNGATKPAWNALLNMVQQGFFAPRSLFLDF